MHRLDDAGPRRDGAWRPSRVSRPRAVSWRAGEIRHPIPREVPMIVRQSLVVLSLAAVLGACGGSRIQQVSPTPNGVAYEYHGASLADVSAKASKHCSRYGRTANLTNVSQLGNENEVASFECR
jgi:hypothetical protein